MAIRKLMGAWPNRLKGKDVGGWDQRIRGHRIIGRGMRGTVRVGGRRMSVREKVGGNCVFRRQKSGRINGAGAVGSTEGGLGSAEAGLSTFLTDELGVDIPWK